MNQITGWLIEASSMQKRTLLAASLGWMLDSMDVMIYALVLGAVQLEMHLSAAMSGAMMSATLVSAAAGGLGFASAPSPGASSATRSPLPSAASRTRPVS